MTRTCSRYAAIAAFSLALAGSAAMAEAACLVEYKAKRDNPLELFYDVAEVPGPCTRRNAKRQIQAMLAQQGLILLKVLSVTEN